jgi:cation diffusion facilitator CzcD-associated flavoprotein CzcO
MDVELPKTSLKRIVIVGGGFGGIELAKKLDEEKYQIILLDRRKVHGRERRGEKRRGHLRVHLQQL